MCAGSAGIRNCGAFCRTCIDFCQTRRNSASVLHFHGKKRRNPPALYKMAHSNMAIKVQRLCQLSATFLPSKYGAFGGRKPARMLPCFQVPLRHVCCSLLTHSVYTTSISFCRLSFKPLPSCSSILVGMNDVALLLY